MEHIVDCKKRYVLILLVLFIAMPTTAIARKKVSGYVIQGGTNTPVEGARVRIWDYDRMSNDELMATTTTDSDGYYRLIYGCDKGEWDTHYPGTTSWRPDIYITVDVIQRGNWVRIHSTLKKRKSNHKCRIDIYKDLRVTIP